MGVKVGDPEGPLSSAAEKSSSCWRSSEEEAQATTTKKQKKRCWIGESLVAQRARVLKLLAIVRSTSGTARKEIKNRDLNATINIRRCAVLKARSAELTRSNFVGSLPDYRCTWVNQNR